MFRRLVVVVVFLSSFVTAASGEPPLPKPWRRSLFNQPPYEAGLDQAVLYEGRPSIFIRAEFPHLTEIGPGKFTAKFSAVSGVRQAIKADRYRGQRVRWSGYLHTNGAGSVWSDGFTGAHRSAASQSTSPGAGLYVVVDSRDGTVLYAMTRDRLIGENDWTKLEIVFDVAPQSALVTLGIFLAGKGELWATGFGFEEVSPSLPTTSYLDLTGTQIYDYTFARHKKRLKEYGRLPDAPVLQTRAENR